jgi:arylsulfatase A-like enzyme
VIGEKFGYAQGFRKWVDLDREDAAVVNRSVAAELETLKTRFFLYVHYLDPHNPYKAPAPHADYFTQGRGKAPLPEGGFPRAVAPDFPKESLELIQLHYDNEIRHVDDEFGKLLAMMKAKGSYENTVILVMSDHGEQFGEHGYFLHSNGVHTEVVDVPLLLRIPRGPRGVVLDTYVQHSDLLPTLTQVLSVEDTAPRMGQSVFTAPARRPIVVQHLRKADLASESILEGGLKLVRRLHDDNAPWRLYDINADPKEAHDLLARTKPSPEAQALAAKLDAITKQQRAWIRKSKDEADDEEGESVELDDKDMVRLRALGYAQ